MKIQTIDPNGLKSFYLFRNLYHPEGTFGTLIYEFPICQTVERYWKMNEKDASCIPAGKYKCKKSVFTRSNGTQYPCLEVLNVPGNRTSIKMHRGNDPMLDITGCILPGMEVGRAKTYMGVLRSTEALNRIMDIVGDDDEVMLTIVDTVGFEYNPKEAFRIGNKEHLSIRVSSDRVPELVMEKMEGVTDIPKLKHSFVGKLRVAWWTVKPYLQTAMKAGGKVIAPVNPLLGAGILIAGEILTKLKGNKEVERRTKLNAWSRLIDALMDWAKKQKNKEQ